MQTFVRNLVLGLGLVSAIAISAQAQTTPVAPGDSIANLPPDAAPLAPAQGDLGTQAVAPSGNLDGPDPGKGWYAKEQPTHAVTPSAGWEGPDPGKGWYAKEQPSQAVAPSPAWDGPKPN
ncbi:MAG: hypothetical protein ACM3JG_15825 [Thiohalocapsa sp.]